MPTAVVTGGAGFLGSHLCEHLLAQGQRVICVDNLQTSTLENIKHLRDDGFTFLNHDVVDPIEVDEPVDFVYHLAALASPIDYMREPLLSLKVGSYGTHNALGLAKWKRARFLLASTSEVYGDPLVHAPGARERAADRFRRRLADAQLLLRRRSDPRSAPARRQRRAPAGQPREPERVFGPRACANSFACHFVKERDRVRSIANRRSSGSPAGHHTGQATARLGTGDRAGRGSAAHVANPRKGASWGLNESASP